MRVLLRIPPRVGCNYVRYARSVGRVRRRGPDRLSFAPPSVVVWVTARCNKDCSFCHYHGELNRPDCDELELSYDQFARIVTHPLVSKAMRVCLYGGEPLLNRDLFKMIRLGRERGHLVTVNTNGLLLGRCRDEMLASGLDMLSVSYYPEDEAVLAETMPRVAPQIPTRFIFLLSERNLRKVRDVLQLAAGAGVRAVSFEHPCPNHSATGSAVPIADRDLTELKPEMNAKYGRHVWISWPESSPGEATCRFFWNSLFVNARGQTSPCCVWPMSTYEGDLFADETVWNSERMMQLRANMRKGEFAEYCRTCSYLHDDPLGI